MSDQWNGVRMKSVTIRPECSKQNPLRMANRQNKITAKKYQVKHFMEFLFSSDLEAPIPLDSNSLEWDQFGFFSKFLSGTALLKRKCKWFPVSVRWRSKQLKHDSRATWELIDGGDSTESSRLCDKCDAGDVTGGACALCVCPTTGHFIVAMQETSVVLLF